jgi:hypothetical protein
MAYGIWHMAYGRRNTAVLACDNQALMNRFILESLTKNDVTAIARGSINEANTYSLILCYILRGYYVLIAEKSRVMLRPVLHSGIYYYFTSHIY